MPLIASRAGGSAGGFGGLRTFGAAAAVDTGAMFPLGMVRVGSGGSASISFTSIPQTYKHLQIRGVSKTNRNYNGNFIDGILMSFNSTAETKTHNLTGFSSNPASSSTDPIYTAQNGTGATAIAAEIMGAQVIDILDYTSSNNKTTRGLFANEVNIAGSFVGMGSALHTVNTGITSIVLTPYIGSLFLQYTTFALYGIKGA